MFDSIHHVAIIASDYEKSKHFYSELLGFPVIHEAFREERKSYKCDLEVGESQIELFSFRIHRTVPINLKQPGSGHLCFGVKDIAQTVKELESKGIMCEGSQSGSLYRQKIHLFQGSGQLAVRSLRKVE
ncbi:MAG: VOC family protein [Alkalibacterium sp.]|nr:VOC family protein [Alkalibacterium sp.]